MSVFLTFCGAAGTVTGSCYLITHPGGRFLVDCGMFQGPKIVRELNYLPFPFEASEIDFVLLTHAHIDHSGLLPKLFRAGFEGPVYTTPGTRDLLTYMLPDSGHIQESEVEHLNRRNAQRGRKKVTPIYTQEDAEHCLSLIRTVDYDAWKPLGEGLRARWWNAGHILGSASIELEIATGETKQRVLRLLFSGDIGPEHSLFLPHSEAPENLDYVICESTYGDRERQRITAKGRRAMLKQEINTVLERNGVLLIPSFAIERTQELLLDMVALMRAREVPKLPIFLDSPLAINATRVFSEHLGELENVPAGGDPFADTNIHFTATADESKAIARFDGRAIIMAASGMCDAGRIRHHLKRYLWQDHSTVLLVGYQAPGTLGWLLAQGRKRVRIHGEEIAVRARIRQIDCYSGHADQSELVEWARARLPLRRGLFITHGEEDSRQKLRELIVGEGLSKRRIYLPRLDETFDLLTARGPQKQPGARRLAPRAVPDTDWHNDYSAFVLELQNKLYEASSDKERDAILRRMKRGLKQS